MCGEHASFVELGTRFVKNIFDSHMKIIYRCLYIGRPALANPALKLLTNMTTFHRGLLTNDLFSAFDLSMTVLPKLLALKEDVKVDEAKRKQIRGNFVKFYLSFISNSSVIVRRDLIAQKRVVSNWFKFLSYDDADTILLMVKTFDQKVLREPSYLKATKINLFNDWSVSLMARLLGRSDIPSGETENVGTIIYNFLVFLTSDMTYGIRFPNKQWFLSEDEEEIDPENPVNNRILLAVIKSLKPWEHIQRQDLVLSILSNCPELVAPYFKEDYGLSLEPKMSVFWISNILFLSRFIQTPLPIDVINSTSFQPPKVEVMIEHILPSPLSKVALTKSLLHPTSLVKFNGLQIIIFAFNKLERVIALYKSKNWAESYYQLIEEVLNRIPDLQTITNSANSIEDMEKNRLLKTIMIKAIALYSNILPEIFVKSKFSLPKSLTTSLEKIDMDGLELVDLRNVLEVQAKLGGIGKWWNKSPELPYSLFTTLLRLCALLNDKLFTEQITSLVEYLSKPTMLFRDATLISPVSILIHSLRTSIPYMTMDEQNKVWKLLDESVSRCLRSPYKYLDKLAALQKKVGAQKVSVSPFLAIIIEQWKYVDKTSAYSKAEQWFQKYVRDSIVSGENYAIILELATDAELSILGHLKEMGGSFSTIKDKWVNITEDAVLNEYYCERILSFPSAKLLKKPNEFILNVVDLFFLRYRLLHEEDSEVRKHLLSKLTVLPLKIRSFILQEEFWDCLLTVENHKLVCGFLEVIQASFNELELQTQKGFVELVSRLKQLILNSDLAEEKAALVQRGSWILDEQFLKNSLDYFLARTEIYDISSLFDRYLTLNIGKSLPETAMKSIIDYAMRSLSPASILASLKQYVDKTPIVINSLFIETLKEYCGKPAFSASQVLSSLIRRLPLLDTKAIEGFVGNSYIDDLTFLTIVKEFFGDAVNDEQKKEALQPLILSTIGIVVKALGNSNDTQLLTAAISVADQLLTLRSNDELEHAIVRFVLESKGTETILPETVSLVGTLYSRNTDEKSPAIQAIRVWSQRCILWLNKRLAEDDFIGEKAELLISSLTSIVNKSKLNLWLVVPTDSLNTLLEIASNKYLNALPVLKMIASFILPTRLAGKQIEFTKLLQIILNHDKVLSLMELDKSSANSTGSGLTLAYIIYTLFHVDVTRHSNKGIQDKVLTLCMGTQRPQDMLMIEILRKIESRTSISFANSIYSWVFSAAAADAFDQQSSKTGLGENYDDTLLSDAPTTKITQMFTYTRDGFEATVDSYLIKNTVRNFDCTVPFFPYMNALSSNHVTSFEEKFELLMSYTKLLRSEYTYDLEFLLLMLASSNIVRESQVTDLKTLVETGGLGAIICCLSYPSTITSGISETSKQTVENGVSKIAFSFLNACLASIKDSTYREEDLLRIFLTKILFYFEDIEESDTDPKSLPTSVCVFLAQILEIASNPGHFLYAQAINEYILVGHSIRPTEIPLYRNLTTASKTDDGGMGSGDLQGKELVWLADTLISGLVTLSDINLYLKAGVFEWLFNLTSTIPLVVQSTTAGHAKFQNSFYVMNHNALRLKTRQLVQRAQEIQGGSTALLTRSGLLAWIQTEQQFGSSVVSSLTGESAAEEQANLAKLGLRSVFTINDAKLREWTDTSDVRNTAMGFKPHKE